MVDKKIVASFILEILGRPKEHVDETLADIIKKIDSEKGVSVREKIIHDSKELEEKDKEGNVREVKEDEKLYTSFAEVEAEFEKIENLIHVIFNYMPSHLEVISPEHFAIDNHFMSEILTSVLLKLHKYDEVAKGLMNEREFIINKLREKLGDEKLKEIFKSETD